jgi:RimJ/RimL family protein N-acetyltransferase
MTLPKQTLTGKSINLRAVTVGDAAFILKLRLDATLNTHLSATDPDVHKQVAWIEQHPWGQGQYYCIVEDKNANAVGTVRLYDFQGDSFCWGSWILLPEAPRKAAIESALMVYEFGFYKLGFLRSHFDVRKQNTRVIDFHQRLGAKIVRESALDYFFSYSREDYEAIKERYQSFLP